MKWWSYYGHATDSNASKVVCDNVKELNGILLEIKSGQSKELALSVTEVEISAGVICAQYLLYVMRIFE